MALNWHRGFLLAGFVVVAGTNAAVAQSVGPGSELEARISKLINDLGADEYEVREAATAELKKIGMPAVGALEKAVQSADLEVRTRAERILQYVRFRPSAALRRKIGGIMDDYSEKPPHARRIAARLALHWTGTEGKPLLCAFLRHEKDVGVLTIVLDKARLFRDDPEVVALAAAAAERTEPEQLRGLLESLADLPGEPTCQILLRSVRKDPPGKVADEAWRTLRRSAVTACAWSCDEKVLACLRELAADPAEPEDLRVQAVTNLAQWPDPGSEALFRKLLDEEDEQLARAAAVGLLRLDEKKHLEAVLARLKKSADQPDPLQAWANVISGLRDQRLVPLARQFLESESANLRWSGLLLAANLRQPSLVPLVREVLKKETKKDTDQHVVAATSAWTLGEIGGPAAAEALAELVRDPRPSSITYGAIEALYALGDARGEKALVSVLKALLAAERSDLAEVRRLLLRFKPQEALPLLQPRLAAGDKHAAEIILAYGPDPQAFRVHVRQVVEQAKQQGGEWAYATGAEALAKLGVRQAAEKVLRRGERYPDLLFGHQLALLMDLGNYEWAHQNLVRYRAEISSPTAHLNNTAWFLLVPTEAKYRDPRQAIKLAEAACAASPHTSALLDTLATAYYLDGQHQKAVAVFRQAIAHHPRSEPAVRGQFRARLVRALWKAGQKGEARKQAALAAREGAKDGEAQYWLIGAYLLLDQPDEAIKCLQNLVKLGFCRLGWLEPNDELDPLRPRQDFQEALKALKDLTARREKEAQEILKELDFPPQEESPPDLFRHLPQNAPGGDFFP